MRGGFIRRNCWLCGYRSQLYFLVFIERQVECLAVFSQKVFFRNERHSVHFDLSVFILIRFVYAQTEHNLGVSAAADAVFAQANTAFLIFVFQHCPELFQHFFRDSYGKHIQFSVLFIVRPWQVSVRTRRLPQYNGQYIH